MGDGGFQVCSAQLVARTGGGRTALQLKCHAKDTTIILEAIVDQETWLWMPRACNDINVLHRSTLFARLSNEESPPVEFQANGHTYKGYYLAGGIYLKWATFVMPFPSPQGKKQLGFHVLKQMLGRMWRGHLGFCKPSLLICKDRLGFWSKKSFSTS